MGTHIPEADIELRQGLPEEQAGNGMPAFVKKALGEAELTAAYQARPPYQRNDYIGWITSAKQPATQQKRLSQMLQELRGGKRYMNMKWNAGSAS